MTTSFKGQEKTALNHKAINRGDYCHRFFICSAKKRIDPEQTVCLICNDFLPIFPEADPLALAKTQGLVVGKKIIKIALEWEARQIEKRPAPAVVPEMVPLVKINGNVVVGTKAPAPVVVGNVDEKTLTVPELYRQIRSRKKVKGEKGKRPAPKKQKRGPGKPPAHKPPGLGMKRCSRPDCENPVLPSDEDHFYRSKHTPDGLMYYCKTCHNKLSMLQQKKKRAAEKRAKEVMK